MRGLGLLLLALFCASALAEPSADQFPDIFQIEVKNSVRLSSADIARYRELMAASFNAQRLPPPGAEFVVLVDRNPDAQRALVFIGGDTKAQLVGATKASTGSLGRFDYYVTPLGVFEHTLLTDFRAQGTPNEHGVRGYGEKGMRIWDFGWQKATKGWGTRFEKGEFGDIRLQLHATDPKLLESRLGQRASKGCVRIPSALNKFLDEYGVLDAHYDEQAARGPRPWVWGAEHVQTGLSGRYLVIIDTAAVPVGR